MITDVVGFNPLRCMDFRKCCYTGQRFRGACSDFQSSHVETFQGTFLVKNRPDRQQGMTGPAVSRLKGLPADVVLIREQGVSGLYTLDNRRLPE